MTNDSDIIINSASLCNSGSVSVAIVITVALTVALTQAKAEGTLTEGGFSTVDVLILTSLDQLHWIL
jgi:hypothetical protein